MSLPRILYLIRNEWTIKWKIYSILLAFGALITILNYATKGSFVEETFNAVIGLNNRITTINGTTIRPSTIFNGMSNMTYFQKFHFDWFPQIYKLLCILIVSLSFWEFRKGSTSNFHISLPAKISEKWIAKFLFSFVVFPICIIIVYQLFAHITYGASMNSGTRLTRLDFLDPYLWRTVRQTFLLQLWVFAIATIFRKYSIVITALVSLGGLIITNVITNLVIKQTLDGTHHSPFDYLGSKFSFINTVPMRPYILERQPLPWWDLPTFTTLFTVVFCLGLSYFTFREIEG